MKNTKTQTPAKNTPTKVVTQSILLNEDQSLIDLLSVDPGVIGNYDGASLFAAVVADAKVARSQDMARTYLRAVTLPVILDSGVSREDYSVNAGVSKGYVSDIAMMATLVPLGFNVSTPVKATEWARLWQGKNVKEVRTAIRADKASAASIRKALKAFTNVNGSAKAIASAASTSSPNEAAPTGATPSKAEEAEARTVESTKVVRASLEQVEAYLSALAAKPSDLPKSKRPEFALLLEAALEAVNGLSTK